VTTARFIWKIPAISSVVALLAAVPFVWSRDFGWFLFGYFIYIPTVVVICACLLIWAGSEKNSKRRLAALTSIAAIIATSLLVFLGDKYAHDRLAFVFWYPTHQQMIEKFSDKDGVIMTWDSWGMAGMENDAYLISSPSDAIFNIEVASKWVRSRHLKCPIVDVQRMRHGLYIFTTYNCSLEFRGQNT
jgi:hypothetical protein